VHLVGFIIRTTIYVCLLWIIAYILKTFWCQLPEEDKIIAPKPAGVMWKIVRKNYTVVHMLVLRELFAKNLLSVCILYTGCSYLILFLRATVLTTSNPTFAGTYRDLLRA